MMSGVEDYCDSLEDAGMSQGEAGYVVGMVDTAEMRERLRG